MEACTSVIGTLQYILPKENVDLDYLNYALSSIDFKKYVAGAAIPHIYFKDYKEEPILWVPLSEQKRIVSILDKGFSAIDKAKANTERNLQNVREFIENHLQAVFENKGIGWEEANLGDIAVFRNGMNFTKSSKGEKIKIVGVKDFQDNFWVPFEDLESVIINGKLNEIDTLCTNDIIAVRSNGNPALIGRTMLAGMVNEKVAHSGFAIRIRLNSVKTISPVYLCRFLKTQNTRRKLVEQGNGVGIKSLNQGSLSSLVISFPKELNEQQKIVGQLDILLSKVQQLQVLYQKRIADLDEMKKSILRKAFNGELN
jgi:type I restriction enzyme S subunit